MNVIKFYKADDLFGDFSNFSNHPITIDGLIWPTTEHYFQAQKFHLKYYQDKIRHAAYPGAAARLGRDRTKPLRDDWEQVKDDVMYTAIKAKFTQHEDLKALLLSTDDSTLIEDTGTDYYWGCGANGSGKNMLGILLMKLREELKGQTNES